MKTLRTIGLFFLFIVAIGVVAPYFLPRLAGTSDELIINAKPEVIFRQVNKLENWENWSPFEKDTSMQNWYMGPDRGVDAMRYWEGEEVGRGTMVIIDSDPYRYIQSRLYLGEDGSGSGGFGSWNFIETDNGTRVIWNINLTNLKYFERWFGLIIDFTLKSQITEGLNNLKTLTEAMPAPIEVKKIILDPQPSMVVYDSSTMDGMEAMFEKNYGDLMDYIIKNNIPVTGEQFAVYHNWDPTGYIRISAGVPVDSEHKGSGRVSYFELPGGEAVFAKHVGGYNSAATHYAIDDYIKDFNIETRDFIWEVYLYNPEIDTDSTKWVTFIYYPIK